MGAAAAPQAGAVASATSHDAAPAGRTCTGSSRATRAVVVADWLKTAKRGDETVYLAKYASRSASGSHDMIFQRFAISSDNADSSSVYWYGVALGADCTECAKPRNGRCWSWPASSESRAPYSAISGGILPSYPEGHDALVRDSQRPGRGLPQRAPDLSAAVRGLAGSQEIVVCEFERREVGPKVFNLTRW